MYLTLGVHGRLLAGAGVTWSRRGWGKGHHHSLRLFSISRPISSSAPSKGSSRAGLFGETLKTDNPRDNTLQPSTLTQNVTGPVAPITPRIYWSSKIFTGPTSFFFNITKKKHCIQFIDIYFNLFYLCLFQTTFGDILEGENLLKKMSPCVKWPCRTKINSPTNSFNL